MVQILKDLRINSKIIDFIVRFCKNIYGRQHKDTTREKQRNRNRSNNYGIRQGCTASTVLFKLITYKIIKEMRKNRRDKNIGTKNYMSLLCR